MHLNLSAVTETVLPHWHSVVGTDSGLCLGLASLLHLENSNDVNEVTADLHEYT